MVVPPAAYDFDFLSKCQPKVKSVIVGEIHSNSRAIRLNGWLDWCQPIKIMTDDVSAYCVCSIV